MTYAGERDCKWSSTSLEKKNRVKHVIQISLVFTSCVSCLDILFGGKSLWISSFFLSYGGAIMVNQV